MKVIKHTNLPAYMPINFTLIGWLYWDRYHPAQWIVTIFVIWTILLWVGCFSWNGKREHVDIFRGKE